MNYRRIVTSVLVLLAGTFAFAQTQDTVTHRLRPTGRLNKNLVIDDLQRQIDSLQKAYDSLYVEYQSVIQPVNITDTEDLITDNDTTTVELPDYTPENIDSLLHAYYIQMDQQLTSFDFESMDRDTLTSSIPDSVYIARLNSINSFIPLQFNRYVKNDIIHYTEKIPKVTARILGLAPYYLPQFEEIFDEFDMPKELKAMAVIESALNAKAVSRARAKGMWQFIYTTGRRYGLNITSFVDERFDPVTACRAAAQYLKDSYMIFGDWQLAIASYNCGTGNVNKAIRRSGGKTDFWEIYPYLPRETRGYIPAFIAALYVLQYYPEHGIVPAQVTLPAHIDTIHVNKMLHFQQVSDNIGISMETLRELNPQYLHDIIPGTERQYVLRLPYNYTGPFVEKEADIYSYKDSVFFNETAITKIKETGGGETGGRIVHRVKKGETLGGIASRYRTSVANIKRWNGLRSNTIQVGQRLVIYGKKAAPKSTTTTAKPAPGGGNKTTTSGEWVMYTVRKGDTLSAISSRNHVSLGTLMNLNGLSKNSKIYPGMKLRIKKAQ
ncbi:MAG: LysM peptidoglycan-binding domain-containing protein [Bacteroidales bacterium]|nr:LysM peptidoglycan-binding domain-containing protein [Bacteroidales bacterium]